MTELYLKKNVGALDRIIRITLGAAMVALPAIFQLPGWSIAVLAAIGGVQIYEGIIAY